MISPDDYLLLREASMESLHKTRFTLKQDDLFWDVDFFSVDKGSPFYLVMAEVEMPEGTPWQPTIHPLLEGFDVAWVPPGDKRFFNRHLSDPCLVSQLLEEFIHESKTTPKLTNS